MHLMVNELIERVYWHIKHRRVGYKLEMVNRFNSVVYHLHNGHPPS